MYDSLTRARVLAALTAGRSLSAVSRDSGIARATIREWRDSPRAPDCARRRPERLECFRCTSTAVADPDAYLYLLGQYLGDGWISEAPRTTALRIACADAYPGIKEECEQAVRRLSGRPLYRVPARGCAHLTALWQHWPCLFPQHGRGRKHERAIVLVDWQQRLVDTDARPLIRGLIHSDGSRFINTVAAGGRRGATATYSYPRYMFFDESADIIAIFTAALDRLGIAWRMNRYNSVSIARREAVAALDGFVGPKY